MNNFIPNSTQIPNILIDQILPLVPEAEYKCLLYICRRTFGFRRDRDRITFNQFINGIKNKDGERLDHGTGLCRDSVAKALANLETGGAIKVSRSGNGRSRQNLYEINLDMDSVKVVETIRKNKTDRELKPKQKKLFSNCGKLRGTNVDEKSIGLNFRPTLVGISDQYRSEFQTNKAEHYNVPVKKQREIKRNKELACAQNKNYESIGDILKKHELPDKKSKITKWQDLALEILDKIPDAKEKRSSVFKCCKENEQAAKIAMLDTLELGKPYVLYFLKVFNNLAKV